MTPTVKSVGLLKETITSTVALNLIEVMNKKLDDLSIHLIVIFFTSLKCLILHEHAFVSPMRFICQTVSLLTINKIQANMLGHRFLHQIMRPKKCIVFQLHVNNA